MTINKKLYFLRHTSVAIEKGTCYGHSDIPLSKKFETEAALIDAPPVALVYSSPLKRCQLLAEKLYPNQTIIQDDRLKELNFGDYELKRWRSLTSEKATLWRKDPIYSSPPNGESFSDLVFRVEQFIESLPNEPILICTHSGVIRAALSIVHDIPLQEAYELNIDYGQLIQISN